MENKTLTEWLDQQQVVLHKQAEHAGLLDHSTMVGDAREFIVDQILRRLLPASIEIGSGQIFDAFDNRSRQIDIILYDSRFPALRGPARHNLYFAEGVLATLEIKSTLNKTELWQALENCRSVLQMRLRSLPANEQDEQLSSGRKQGQLSLGEMRRRIYEVTPACYVFAFKKGVGFDMLAKHVDEWFIEERCPTLIDGPARVAPSLPRLIIDGTALGMLNDGWLKAEPPEQDFEIARRQFGANAEPYMFFLNWEEHFAWLVAHILRSVMIRQGQISRGYGVVYNIDEYLRFFDEYVERISERETAHLFWNPVDT